MLLDDRRPRLSGVIRHLCRGDERMHMRRHDGIHDLTKKPRQAQARMLNKLVAPPVAVSRPVETTRASHCLGVVYG